MNTGMQVRTVLLSGMATESDIERAKRERQNHRLRVTRKLKPKRPLTEAQKATMRERSRRWRRENKDRRNAYYREYSKRPGRILWCQEYYRNVLKPKRQAEREIK